jgi:hypothetical protein
VRWPLRHPPAYVQFFATISPYRPAESGVWPLLLPDCGVLMHSARSWQARAARAASAFGAATWKASMTGCWVLTGPSRAAPQHAVPGPARPSSGTPPETVCGAVSQTAAYAPPQAGSQIGCRTVRDVCGVEQPELARDVVSDGILAAARNGVGADRPLHRRWPDTRPDLVPEGTGIHRRQGIKRPTRGSACASVLKSDGVRRILPRSSPRSERAAVSPISGGDDAGHRGTGRPDHPGNGKLVRSSVAARRSRSDAGRRIRLGGSRR